MIYASELAAKSIGIAPIGDPSPHLKQCCMCGRDIPSGMPSVSFKASESFMDGRALVGDGREICGYCAAHWNKKTMMALQKFCATEHKAWKLYAGVHRAWMLENLPDEPFVFCLSDSKLQHLVWRTPVSLSRDFFRIRFGNRIFDIRRKVIFQGRDLSLEISNALAEDDSKDKKGKRRGKPKVAKHPFVTVDSAMSHSRFGALRHDFLDHSNPRVSSLTRAVADLRLSVGEILMVGILCNYEAEEPEQIVLK